jgi:hypothetical protein
MPVYHCDYDFGTAYRDELLRAAKRERLAKKAKFSLPSIRDRLMLRLGNTLISVGMRIRKEHNCSCAEFSRGRV